MPAEKQALARELVALTGSVDKACALVHKVFSRAPEGVTVDSLIDMTQFRTHHEEVAVRVVAEALTEEELRALVVFHTSALGWSIRAKQEQIERRLTTEVSTYLVDALMEPK